MSNTFFHIFPHENFIDLGMYQYGYEQCDPGHSFGRLPEIIIFSTMSFPELEH